MKRTRLITLGTLGGPNPRAKRAQTSNLLIVDGEYYLIDAGDGAARRLAKARIPIREIGTIFITHHHDDHTAGLGTLMSVAWDQQRTKPIHVYGPPGTERLVTAAVEYFGPSSEIRIADGGRSVPIAEIFFGHDVGTGMIYQDKNIEVTAAENTHYGFHKEARFKSYALRFETPDRVIAFTGDTGWSEAVVALVKNADLLVTETSSFEERKQRLIAAGQWQAMSPAEQAGTFRQGTQGHMDLEAVGKTAAAANVKTLVLSHLTARADGGDDYSAWADEVRKYFSGEVLIAEDLMEF
jgi:ribonuclease BN (tRNA processing enzyme)